MTFGFAIIINSSIHYYLDYKLTASQLKHKVESLYVQKPTNTLLGGFLVQKPENSLDFFTITSTIGNKK